VIALLVCLGLTGCLFAAAWLFAMEGVRAGDRPGDTIVSAVGVVPGEHALVCIVEPDDRVVVRLAPPPTVPRRQELVVAIGEPDRLRVLHRAVTPPQARRAGPPPATAERLAP
jgi:hypothetical protein